MKNIAKLYLILSIIFSILTFVGIFYVLANKGMVSAGYSVVPMLFAIIFIGAYRNNKKVNKTGIFEFVGENYAR